MSEVISKRVERFTVEIKTENAAFSDGCEPELARILQRLAKELEYTCLATGDEGPLIDFNGNKVGRWECF